MNTRPWYKSYPKGMPHEIGEPPFTSLVDLLEKSFQKFRGNMAFEHNIKFMGVRLTYDDIDRLSRDFAAFLQNHTDLKKGDRIAIQMPNCPQYPVVMFGAVRAGFIVVNTNPLYTPREMEHQFKDSGAKAIVILSNFASNLQKVLPNTSIKHVIVSDLPDLYSSFSRVFSNFLIKTVKKMVPEFSLPSAITLRKAMELGASANYSRPEVAFDETVFLQYTGGTTGVSKGAELTHKNIISNMQMMFAWLGDHLVEGKEFIITGLPLYHIFSLTVNCFTFFAFGGNNLLITNPKDMDDMVAQMSKVPFTAITAVNTLFNGMINNENFRKLDFSTLKLSVGGGMAVQRAVGMKWKEVTGCPLSEGYGLTESSPVITCNPLNGQEQLGAIGMPMPSTDVRIVDEEGNDVPRGESGELWAKGPQIMKGYWNRPDETAKTITPDGWLKTGDIAVYQEDGFFRIVDRKKDMILVSGFNVYPNEIEDVIALHPKVLEVAAVGVPDERSVEAVKVFVVKKDHSLTEEELKAYCKENFTGYKVPKHYEFRDELPKSNVGKIIRRVLRDEEIKKR